MKWFFLTCLLPSFCTNCAYHQKLDLYACKRCPNTDEGNKKFELIFNVGSNITLVCKYLHKKQCEQQSTNLTIIPHLPAQDSMIVINRSKCHLKVKLNNLTTNFSGIYKCHDTVNGSSYQRTVKIGYPPVEPTNFTLLYKPLDSISLRFNQVKNGSDLNDIHTKWVVLWEWRGDTTHSCLLQEKDGNSYWSHNGHFLACVIDLHEKHSRYQNYEFGHSYRNITFNITVYNIFGNSQPVITSFRPIEFLKPDTVNETIKVIKRGPTWLQFEVDFPQGIDTEVCNELSKNRKGHLKIKYSIRLLSEFEQSQKLKENVEFQVKYGFWRNIQSDNETAANLSLGFPSYQNFKWQDFNCTMTKVNVTGLPPYTYMNISFQAGGRYWGPELFVNVNDTFTDEGSLQEGPKFPDSPYFCFSEGSCMTCAVYFLEIPRPLRHGRVTEYTLQGIRVSPVQPVQTKSECENYLNFFVKARGQDNTILVQNLAPDATYQISLKAHAKMGASNATSYFLQTNTSLAKGTPTHVIVERNISTYTLSWRRHNVGDDDCGTEYYVHYCFAQSFEVLTEATNNLNCRTNLISQKAEKCNSHKLNIFYSCIKELEPVFFVSMMTPGGTSSALSKVECLYSADKLPEKAESLTVQKSEADPRHLVVSFRIACDQNYRYSQPDMYHIMLKSGECLKNERQQDFQDTAKINPDKDSWIVTQTLTNLQPNRRYCVGIKTEAKNMSQWISQSAVTDDITISWVAGIIFAFLLPVAVGISVFVFYWLKCKSAYKKFEKEPLNLPKPQAKKKNVFPASKVHILQSQSISQDSGCVVSISSIDSGSVTGDVKGGGVYTIKDSGDSRSSLTMGCTAFTTKALQLLHSLKPAGDTLVKESVPPKPAGDTLVKEAVHPKPAGDTLVKDSVPPKRHVNNEDTRLPETRPLQHQKLIFNSLTKDLSSCVKMDESTQLLKTKELVPASSKILQVSEMNNGLCSSCKSEETWEDTIDKEGKLSEQTLNKVDAAEFIETECIFELSSSTENKFKFLGESSFPESKETAQFNLTPSRPFSSQITHHSQTPFTHKVPTVTSSTHSFQENSVSSQASFSDTEIQLHQFMLSHTLSTMKVVKPELSMPDSSTCNSSVDILSGDFFSTELLPDDCTKSLSLTPSKPLSSQPILKVNCAIHNHSAIKSVAEKDPNPVCQSEVFTATGNEEDPTSVCQSEIVAATENLLDSSTGISPASETATVPFNFLSQSTTLSVQPNSRYPLDASFLYHHSNHSSIAQVDSTQLPVNYSSVFKSNLDFGSKSDASDLKSIKNSHSENNEEKTHKIYDLCDLQNLVAQLSDKDVGMTDLTNITHSSESQNVLLKSGLQVCSRPDLMTSSTKDIKQVTLSAKKSVCKSSGLQNGICNTLTSGRNIEGLKDVSKRICVPPVAGKIFIQDFAKDGGEDSKLFSSQKHVSYSKVTKD